MNILSADNASQRIVGAFQSGERSFIPLKSRESSQVFRIDQHREALPVPKEERPSFPINSKGIAIDKSAAKSPEDISARKAKLRKSAEGFEAIFIRQLLSAMSSTLPEGGMMGKGMAGDIYGDIINNALSETMSKKSSFGLADVIYNRMVKTIDHGNNAPSSAEHKPDAQEKAGK